MSHGSLVGGVSYEITGGKTLINSTAYNITGGETLVNGSVYKVPFEKELVIYDGGSDVLVGSINFMAAAYRVFNGNAALGGVTTHADTGYIANGSICLKSLQTGSTVSQGYPVTIYAAGLFSISGLDLSQYTTLHAIMFCDSENISGSIGISNNVMGFLVVSDNVISTSAVEVSVDISKYSDTAVNINGNISGITTTNKIVHYSKIWLT